MNVSLYLKFTFRALNTIAYDTIRYDTICYFNVRSKADISQLNLPHMNLSEFWRLNFVGNNRIFPGSDFIVISFLCSVHQFPQKCSNHTLYIHVTV